MKASTPINDPIKLNKLHLFSSNIKSASNTTKSKLTGLKDACKLFGNLYIACQNRSCDLETFFCHENQQFPPAFSGYMGLMRSCDKSDLVDCLLQLSDRTESSSAPLVQAKILDGAAIVRPHASTRSGPNVWRVCEERFYVIRKERSL